MTAKLIMAKYIFYRFNIRTVYETTWLFNLEHTFFSPIHYTRKPNISESTVTHLWNVNELFCKIDSIENRLIDSERTKKWFHLMYLYVSSSPNNLCSTLYHIKTYYIIILISGLIFVEKYVLFTFIFSLLVSNRAAARPLVSPPISQSGHTYAYYWGNRSNRSDSMLCTN